jgi:hypothetical protein
MKLLCRISQNTYHHWFQNSVQENYCFFIQEITILGLNFYFFSINPRGTCDYRCPLEGEMCY